MAQMTRAEHLAWAKSRALEYVDAGDLSQAVSSMGSDLSKHPECGINASVGVLGIMKAKTGDSAGVRRWIEDFN